MKKGWLALGFLLGVVAVSSSAYGAMVYHFEPFAVFITYPEGRYIIGHEMEVMAHFYYDGEPFDPVWVNMSIRHEDEEKLWFNMTRLNTGIYTATFTIAPEHLESNGWLWVSAVGRLDQTQHEREYISDFELVYTEYHNAFGVEYSIPDPSDMAPRPGQVVEFDIWSTYLGALVDPDEGSLVVGVTGPVLYLDETDLIRVGTGHYRGSFTVPADMMTNGRFGLRISANCTRDGFTSRLPLSLGSSIYVNVFSIWVHQKFVNDTMTVLDLYVTDLDGDPVVGATVNLEDGDITGTTDDKGVFEFTLSYPDIEPGTITYHVRGYIEKDGMRQSLWHHLWSGPKVYIISPEPEPRPPRDNSWCRVLDEDLPEDSDVSIRLYSYIVDEPLPGDRIIVSVFNDHEILYYGDGYTGPDGILSVPVHTPNVPEGAHRSPFEIEYQRLADDGDWSGGKGYIDIWAKEAPSTVLERILDPDGYIDVLPFEAGGKIEVWITIPEADGGVEIAGACWGFGDPLVQGAPGDPAWITWIPRAHGAQFFDGVHVRGVWDDGRYKVVIDLPHFIPEDEELYIAGYVRFFDSVGFYRTRYVLLTNVTPTASDQPPIVTITVPETGGVYTGTIDLSGTAIDDQGIVRIEVSIDGGAWSIAEGTTSWTFSLNTIGMSLGDHTLTVRAWDAGTFAQRSTTFVVDGPPSVTVTRPVDDVDYGNLLEIHGMAEDDVGVLRVEFRIDGGEWMVADGTDEWHDTIDTRKLADGTHTLECRAFDMYTSSRTVTVEFGVSNPDVRVSTPGLPSAIVALALLSVAGTLIWNEDRKNP